MNKQTTNERCELLASHAVLTVQTWGPCAVAYRSVRECADEIIALRTAESAQQEDRL